MKKLTILLAFVLFSFSSYCQSDSSVAGSSLIYLNGFSWQQGNKKLSSKALQNELYKTPKAISYFKKGKINTTLSTVFLIGAALFTVAATVSEDGRYHTVKGPRFSFNILAATSFVAGAFTLKFSLKNKGRAVHLRNLDLINR